jgi:DNA-directed RNA polymerase specialized sigma24 family protein
MPYAIRPLRKTNKVGKLYTHKKETSDALQELLGLDEATLESRCNFHSKDQVGFVTSECLVYLLRTTKGSERIQSVLFDAVMTRVTRLARAVTKELPQQYADDIVEIVVSRFIEFLCADKIVYELRLDPLERIFRITVVADCRDALRSIRRKERKYTPIEEYDEDTPLPQKVQDAIDKVGDEEFLRTRKKAEIVEAIDKLPEFHAKILKFELLGYPVHSVAGNQCMTRKLKMSEKTINTHRKLALAELQRELQGE